MMQQDVKQRGTFWWGFWVACWVVLGGAVVIAVKTGSYGFAIFLALLAVAGLGVHWITWTGDLFSQQARQAEMSALEGLDMLNDGFRIVGDGADRVLALKTEHDFFGGNFSQLCRTQSGRWFVFDFMVFKGKVYDHKVAILKEDEVKQLLMEKQGIEEYRKYFGEPDVL
jgi:hypothetical protein